MFQKSPAGNCPHRMIEAPRAGFVLMEGPVHISRVSRFRRFSALVPHAGPRRPGPFPFSLPVGPLELFSAPWGESDPDRQPEREHERSHQPDIRKKGRNHLGPPARDATPQTISRTSPIAQTKAGLSPRQRSRAARTSSISITGILNLAVSRRERIQPSC